ncbi:hypothetical protein C8J38_1312 [Rhizobium sp. PP-WC-2G-219]|nr:hypothetical protein C8J38_1312 [Rhizobium sp. PP-WC-2G-219]
MSADDEQKRERAYRIWEDEGRPEGRHDDHWKRAGERALADQVSEDVTKTNQEADQDFADVMTARSRPRISSCRRRSAPTEPTRRIYRTYIP